MNFLLLNLALIAWALPWPCQSLETTLLSAFGGGASGVTQLTPGALLGLANSTGHIVLHEGIDYLVPILSNETLSEAITGEVTFTGTGATTLTFLRLAGTGPQDYAGAPAFSLRVGRCQMHNKLSPQFWVFYTHAQG